MTTFYHYTCDHGRAALGECGTLQPFGGRRRFIAPWPARYVWVTDLDTPVRDALGLTSSFLMCDRTRFRYRVLEPSTVQPWADLAGQAGVWRAALEEAPGARPKHWYFSVEPVPVVYDPVGGGR